MLEVHIQNPNIIPSLKIVLAMATRLYCEHAEICSPAKNPFETEQALHEVDKFILTLEGFK